MKKLIFAVLLFAVGAVHAQQGNDVMVRQRNATNTGWLDKFLSPPASGADGIMYINNNVNPPLASVVEVGAGLSVSGGVLSATGSGGVNADWNATSGPSQILNKPVLFSGAYSALTGIPTTFTPSAHTHPFSQITSTPTTLGGYGITDAYPLSGNPAGYLTGITAGQVTGALGFTPYNSTNPAGYITSTALSPYLTSATASSTYATSSALTSGLAGKQNTLSLTTTGTGAATLSGSTLNIPTPIAATAFNYSLPVARTLAMSTSYQAADTSKAAIIYPSYACQNATTVLAASGCTIQVRMGTGTLTCSTGTPYYTQSLTVQLGVLITQNSTNPVPIMLPAGASFILCPTVGTFTVTTVEQTAG